MNLREQLVPLGHPNRPGTNLEDLKAIVFHYTANDAPSASDTMNARYFGRPWVAGGPYEASSTPGQPLRDKEGKPVLFSYGSAQVVVDEDSVTIAIPTDEVAWACGDRHAGAWTPELKGQRPLARNLFGNRQNYQTLNIEICNNASWAKACDNAAEYAALFIKHRGLFVLEEQSIAPPDKPVAAPGGIFLLKHWDVTGKACPKPFLGDTDAWAGFVRKIAGMAR